MAKQTVPTPPEELEGKTKAELTDIAESQGVDVSSHMTKAAIVDEIQSAQPMAQPTQSGSTDAEASTGFAPKSGPEAIRDADFDARAALGR